MAFIPAPAGTVRVVVNQTLEGQQVVNAFYCKAPANLTLAELTTLATDIEAAWTNAAGGVTEVQAEDLVVTDVTATNVATAGGLQVVVPSGATGQGGAANPPIANSLAGVVSLRTDQAGRSYRGRMYIAGIASSLTVAGDANHITAAAATQIKDAIVAVDVAAAGAGAPMAIASYYSGVDGAGKPIPRALAVVTDVTAVIGRTLLGTQRRRRPES